MLFSCRPLCVSGSGSVACEKTRSMWSICRREVDQMIRLLIFYHLITVLELFPCWIWFELYEFISTACFGQGKYNFIITVTTNTFTIDQQRRPVFLLHARDLTATLPDITEGYLNHIVPSYEAFEGPPSTGSTNAVLKQKLHSRSNVD